MTLGNSTCAIYLQATFPWNFKKLHCYFKKQMTNYDYSDWVFGRHFFSKMNEVSLHFKENNWQYLLPTIKFELSSKNENFRKLVFINVSLAAFQYFNTCIIKSVILMNVIFFHTIQWNVSTFRSVPFSEQIISKWSMQQFLI